MVFSPSHSSTMYQHWKKKWKLHTYICHQYLLLVRHIVSAATHDDWAHVQFTQPFTAIYSLHGPHLLPVQDVRPKGITQLLH